MTAEDSPGRALLRRRYMRIVHRGTGAIIKRPGRVSVLREVIRVKRREGTLWMRKLARVRDQGQLGRWYKVKTYKTRGTARQTVVNLRRGPKFDGGAKRPPGRWEFTAVGWQVWVRYMGAEPDGGSHAD